MKNLCCTLLIILAAASTLSANNKTPARRTDPNALLLKKWDLPIKDPNDPADVLWTKWTAATKVLAEKSISDDQRAKIIDLLVTPIFDFQLMGKLVLGRKHWPKFDEQQRKTFVKLFTRRLKASYRDKITLYTDQKATLKPAIRKKTTATIPMELTAKDKKVTIIYKMRKLGKTWKVYDVEIQGVSVLLTYRSQFDDVLGKESVKEFLANLAKPPTS